MDTHQRVLFIDSSTGYYRIDRFPVGEPFFGPVDLGLHLAGRFNSLNLGAGLLAGSILPGSNRLIVTGFSPCWGGFYISTMGGAALVFDNLGLNMLALVGRATTPSILYLNRAGGDHVEVELSPVDLHAVWDQGGVYAMMQLALERYGGRYTTEPRVLAVGLAAERTDFGAIASAPVVNGKLTAAETWAGRGGFGTKMLREHNLAAIIFGGTHLDEDFRDRKVADQWFADKYNKRLMTVDFEATTKYRFDPKFQTGGTFGVNFATIGGRLLYCNYRSIYATEDQRQAIHQRFIVDHYLRQFNEETIQPKHQSTCGEPCTAVCKKQREEYKKDYEPYQALGPLCGVFDQRAAEQLVHRVDTAGFDAIAAGGVVAWLMDCLDTGLMKPEELGVQDPPHWDMEHFDVVSDSAHNAQLGVQLIDGILAQRGILQLSEGARRLARQLSRERGKAVLDTFVHAGFGRRGWMVPNQYWTPGVLAPMAIMGKYFMYYGYDFLPPRELGRRNVQQFMNELIVDNCGMCRFHRAWAEAMIPEIIGALYGKRDRYLQQISITASRIHSRNASIYWEAERNIDYVFTFLRRKQEVEGEKHPELQSWLSRYETNRHEAALDFWYEMHKGAQELLREF